MSIIVETPFQNFTGLDGKPLTNGKVYIGQVGTDPTVFANQIPVFWDEALTIPASQPLTTNAGYIVRLGTPARVWVANDYSISVKNSSNVLVYYIAQFGAVSYVSSDDLSGQDGTDLIGVGPVTLSQFLKSSVSCVVDSIDALKNVDIDRFTKAFVTGYYTPGDGGSGMYLYAATHPDADNGGTIITSNLGGKWIRINDDPVNQYVFGAKGTGLITDDDTAALQRWLDWAISGGTGAQKGIHGNTGRHYISGTGLKVAVNDAVPTFTSDGATNFVLTGTASIYMDFSVIGGSGQTSQARWGAIGIDPTSKIPGSIGLLVRGLCSVTFVDWRFNKLNASCIMHNDKAGSFTELVVLENPYFDTSVDGFIWYRVTAGNQSFRSSGVNNGKGNIGQGCLPIVYEPNAVNYFGRMDLTVWNYSANCVLITNQSSQQSLIGNITAEPLRLTGGPAPENNKLTLATGPSTVYLLGRLAAWAFKSTAVFKGVLTLCSEFSNMTDLGQRSRPDNDSGSFTTTTVGEPFAIKYSPGIELPFSPDSAIITIVVTAPGYLWKGYYAMRTGTTPTVVNASPIYSPDLFQTGVTYGAMVVSQGTSRNINVTNPNSMPVGTVLTYNIEYTHGLIPNF